MTRAWLFSFVPVVVLVAAASCGGDDTAPSGAGGGASQASSSSAGGAGGSGGAGQGGSGGAGGGAPAGSVEADYCAPLAELVCAREAACGCGQVLLDGMLDVAACTAAYTAKCLDAYAPLVSLVAQGKAHVLPDRAAECIALVDADTPACERPRGTVTQGLCPAWFTGNAAIGAACGPIPICAEGAGYCNMGVCTPRLSEGASCSQDECAPGLLCLGGKCTAPAEAGGSCAGDDTCAPPLRCVGSACAALAPEGGDCAGSEGCAQGLVCDNGQCAKAPAEPCVDPSDCGNLGVCSHPRRCVVPGSAGDACASDDACATGLHCDAGACVEWPGAGEPCANGTFCGPGLACDGDFGNCAPIPSAGEPCGFGPMGPSVCADGLGCVDGVCGPLPGLNEACTTDYRCADGLGCDFGPNGSTCVALRAAGEPCENDRVCGAGLHCDLAKGVCAAEYPLGAACHDGNECGAGGCTLGPGGGMVCAPRPGAGERCFGPCADGLACVVVPDEAACVPDVCLEL